MKVSCAFSIAACMLLLSGCNKPASIIGAWKGTLFQQDVSAEFKDDKSMSLSLKDGQMGASFSGAYTIDPKALTITVNDYKLSNVPDTLTTLAKQIFDPLKNKSYPLTYHFNSPDEIALTYKGKVDVLKRVPQE